MRGPMPRVATIYYLKCLITKKIMRHAKKQEIMTNTPKETKVGNRNFL